MAAKWTNLSSELLSSQGKGVSYFNLQGEHNWCINFFKNKLHSI